jgi:TPR repeat protein
MKYLLFTVLFLSATFTFAREWQATSGHTLTGDFVKCENGTMSIKLSDGKIATVPFDKLCDVDQNFVKQETAKKENPFVILEENKPAVSVPISPSDNKLNINKDTPFETLKAEAEKDNPDALCWLGLAYAGGLNKYPVDKIKMQECFKKASNFADNSSVSAQFCRGLCLFHGFGVEKNLEEAVKWLRKASEQNFAVAQFWLGGCYFDGKGVEKDEKEAIKWYQKSADNGYIYAQRYIGIFYWRGLMGLEKNLDKALSWFKKAALQGDTEADEIVKRMEKFEKDKTEPETAKTDTENEKQKETIEVDDKPTNALQETKKVFVKGRFEGISQDGKWLFYTAGDQSIIGVRLSNGQNFRYEIRDNNFLGFEGAKISTDGKYAQIGYSVAAGKRNEPLAAIKHITVYAIGNNAGKSINIRAKYFDTISVGQQKQGYVGNVYYQDAGCVISVEVDKDGKIFTVYKYGENPSETQ